MEKLLFRLIMAAVGIAMAAWVLSQLSPFLQSFQLVSRTLGR